MIARLWWKEARQIWPIWAFLVGLGLFWNGAFRWYMGADKVEPGSIAGASLLVTLIYMFLIGAAIFAGERENRTLGLLDALPVERWRVWLAKASFATVSTAVLGLVLAISALLLEKSWPTTTGVVYALTLVGFFLLSGLGWSLFWSSISGNALLAAALAISSLTLMAAQVNSNEPIYGEVFTHAQLTPMHWLSIVATIAASALIFHLGGPPRRSWLGRRRQPRALVVVRPEPEKVVGDRRLGAAWPYALRRLVWQALREVRPVWWPIALIGIGLPIALVWNQSSNDPAPWIVSSIIVGLVSGVNVFNAENRGRTQRFLTQHGARPGVVWLVKVLIGLATVAPIWLVSLWLNPQLWSMQHASRAWPAGWAAGGYLETIPGVVGLIGIFFTSSFATGVLCGMVFRRGITAGMLGLILWLVACLPPFLAIPLGVIQPLHLFWIPFALLAVSWAWSGDWMLDRPGARRWVKLGLLSTVTVVGLCSAYVANRVWTVPTIDPAEEERIFQFARISAPVPPEDNAADLYRQIGLKLISIPRCPVELNSTELRAVVDEDWDTKDPKVIDWLSQNEPILESFRKAAAMPVCQFRDLRKLNIFSMRDGESYLHSFFQPLFVSSRVRLARGDLNGAWTELETLFRMARHFSGLNPFQERYWGGYCENWTLGLAMRWAADPRQTAESLEAARTSYRSLPPMTSVADLLRADALVARNTSELPHDELIQGLLPTRPTGSPFHKLGLDVMTTPWELPRTRRVYNLLAAARIRAVENERKRGALEPNNLDDFYSDLVLGQGSTTQIVSRSDLYRLAATTPQVQWLSFSFVGNNGSQGVNAIASIALDQIFGLRIWQVQHDGRLPRALTEIRLIGPGDTTLPLDPYAQPPELFGYIPSQGQSLLPLGLFDPIPYDGAASTKTGLIPTTDHMLLYSVGPDHHDDRALNNLNYGGRGDIIFPLKDNVPPPKPDAK